MEFEDPKKLAYLVAFVVPGYVWTRVEHRFIVRKRIGWSEQLIGYLVYSLLNYSLWYFFFLPDLARRISSGSLNFTDPLLVLVVLFVSPAIGGVITGQIAKRDWLGKVLGKCSSATVDPHSPTGWDKAFGAEISRLTRVWLEDGQSVTGLWGPGSSASVDSGHRDLFLEVVYEVKEGEPLRPVNMSRGTWIPGDSIRRIEFFDAKGLEQHESVAKLGWIGRLAFAVTEGVEAYRRAASGAVGQPVRPSSERTRTSERWPSPNRSGEHQSTADQPLQLAQ